MNCINRCILLALCVACALAARCQSAISAKDSIDQIKMDAEYVYGEAFDENRGIAYAMALDDLAEYANDMRMQVGKMPISSPDLAPFAQELSYAKGQSFAIFLYISLDQALELPKKPKSVIAEGLSASHASAGQSSAPASHSSSHSNAPACPQGASGEVLRMLCSQDNWIEIKGFMKTFKDEGKIKEIGNCLNPADVPADAYSILIDDMYGILAILYPKNSPARLNARTNQPDNESNYPNCKIIVWYK